MLQKVEVALESAGNTTLFLCVGNYIANCPRSKYLQSKNKVFGFREGLGKCGEWTAEISAPVEHQTDFAAGLVFELQSLNREISSL